MKKLNKILIAPATALALGSCGLLATTLTSCGGINFKEVTTQKDFKAGINETGWFTLSYELTSGTIETSKLSVETQITQQAEGMSIDSTDAQVIGKTLNVTITYTDNAKAIDDKIAFDLIVKHDGKQIAKFDGYSITTKDDRKIKLASSNPVEILKKDPDLGFVFPLEIASENVLSLSDYAIVEIEDSAPITIANSGIASVKRSQVDNKVYIGTEYTFKQGKEEFEKDSEFKVSITLGGLVNNDKETTSFYSTLEGKIKAVDGAYIPEDQKEWKTTTAESTSHTFVFKTLADTTGYTFEAQLEDVVKVKGNIGIKLGTVTATGNTVSVPISFEEGKTFTEDVETSFTIHLACKQSETTIWDVKARGCKLTYGAAFLELYSDAEVYFGTFTYDVRTLQCPERGILFKSQEDLSALVGKIVVEPIMKDHTDWDIGYIEVPEDSIEWKYVGDDAGYHIYELRFSLFNSGDRAHHEDWLQHRGHNGRAKYYFNISSSDPAYKSKYQTRHIQLRINYDK